MLHNEILSHLSPVGAYKSSRVVTLVTGTEILEDCFANKSKKPLLLQGAKTGYIAIQESS